MITASVEYVQALFASDLIKQSIAREKAIEMELDRIRAYLRMFGVAGGE